MNEIYPIVNDPRAPWVRDESISNPGAPWATDASRLYRVWKAQQEVRIDAENQQTPQFSWNIKQINDLITRYKLRNLTFESLQNFPLSRLNASEKEFVRFLQRNPQVFEKISNLDQQPGSISPEDLERAARLTGNSLFLTNEDIDYLQNYATLPPLPEQPSAARRPQPNVSAESLNRLLNRINPNGVNFEELQNVNPNQLNLSAAERESLEFLRSRPVQKMLYNILPQDHMLRPEVLRVLTSLISNPFIYGSLPIVFHQTPFHEDAPSAVHLIDPIQLDRENKTAHIAPYLKVELHAPKIFELLNRLSPGDGHVTLTQLRQYQPQSVEEARIVNTLKQLKVFKMLAAQDEQPDSISEEDIRMVMKEDYLVLYDPYLVLIILPT